MSDEEKITLEKYRKQWNLFKAMRDKKKFITCDEDGWLSMLKRESIIDFLFELFENESLIECG